MGDFNIEIRQTYPESNKLEEFCSLSSLTNVKSDTCFTKNPIKENEKLYKKQRNKRAALRIKMHKRILSQHK